MPKESALATITSLTGVGLVRVVDDSAGTPASKNFAMAADPTLGQVSIGGVELGDTGWRDVSSLLATGWTATTIELRRCGYVCELRVTGLNYSSGGDNTVMSLPTGWSPQWGTDAIHFAGASDSTPVNPDGTFVDVVLYTGELRVITTATDVNVGHCWTTDTVWPASLPGSAA